MISFKWENEAVLFEITWSTDQKQIEKIFGVNMIKMHC